MFRMVFLILSFIATDTFAKAIDSDDCETGFEIQGKVRNDFDTSSWVKFTGDYDDKFGLPCGVEVEINQVTDPNDYAYVTNDFDLLADGPDPVETNFGFSLVTENVFASMGESEKVLFFQVRSNNSRTGVGQGMRLLNVALEKKFEAGGDPHSGSEMTWQLKLVWFDPKDDYERTTRYIDIDMENRNEIYFTYKWTYIGGSRITINGVPYEGVYESHPKVYPVDNRLGFIRNISGFEKGDKIQFESPRGSSYY